MIDFIDIFKKQDILNIDYKQVPCLSCGETYLEDNKIYLITLKSAYGEHSVPICKHCIDSLLFAIDIETNENIIEVE